ncbi:MAG TPA: hypothetical protein VHE34_25700 [Puia sp.]|uniref:hypothetical protein n=1 Tax=Puia sp. TaxID=2045100 RepID=UPI002C4A4D09|nr:hypothetical protein [Puia sp.]HVU98653.1 hypothetical protein [Puia sp.]
MPINLVFVHGWSVTNLNTYGQLPVTLRTALAANTGEAANIHEIWLGRYISFHDEVKLADISRAFQAAVDDQLAPLIAQGERFACITHSTGGPVIRDWWFRYWKDNAKPCPMSHCIMLAPANFGSALARLGKGTLSRLKSWMDGVQPGQGVLDWLELGSQEAWDLNTDWIVNAKSPAGANGFYPFVIIGQSIDRKLYDNLNSYTGEIGSDGVVRSAAANLNASKVIITQQGMQQGTQQGAQQRTQQGAQQGTQQDTQQGTQQSSEPTIEYHTAPATPFLIVKGKSHSGNDKGIMSSDAGQELITAILACLQVTTDANYEQVITTFAEQTNANQQTERLEQVTDRLITLNKRYFIHDRYCMVIFRVSDTEGNPITDYDLLFTAGDNSPNHLPEGFFSDRQQNSRHKETVTYFVNYDILKGAAPVINGEKQVRDAAPGITRLGLQVNPRPDEGFVRYSPLEIVAQPEFFEKMVKPNGTILVDIRLQRLVSKQVFRLEGPLGTAMPDNRTGDFADVKEGDAFIG